MSVNWDIYIGDAAAGLRTLASESVQCVVTSPPYWALRDYGVPGQIGLEPTAEGYVAAMCVVFEEVDRVLRADGTAWINMGDCYINSGGSGRVGKNNCRQGRTHTQLDVGVRRVKRISKTRLEGVGADQAHALRSDEAGRWSDDIPEKSLVGMPWMLAFELRKRYGWRIRQEIIWHKPAPMPESCRDRPTRAHEQLFLFSKASRYFYDADAIAEPARCGDCGRRSVARGGFTGKTEALAGRNAFRAITATRNRRSVWTVAPQPFAGAHFATFPEALVEPCILAGSRVGDLVADPFGGSGTVPSVAVRLGRRAWAAELNPEYAEIMRGRVKASAVQPDLFLSRGGTDEQ